MPFFFAQFIKLLFQRETILNKDFLTAEKCHCQLIYRSYYYIQSKEDHGFIPDNALLKLVTFHHSYVNSFKGDTLLPCTLIMFVLSCL